MSTLWLSKIPHIVKFTMRDRPITGNVSHLMISVTSESPKVSKGDVEVSNL